MTESEARFELKVDGITCVKCAGRIQEALSSYNPPGKNIRVDILTNNVIFSINQGALLNEYINLLNEKGYSVKKIVNVTKINDRDKRILRLKVASGSPDLICPALNGIEGLTNDLQTNGKKEISITYNPLYIRGNEIIKKIYDYYESRSQKVELILENPFEDEEEEEEGEYSLMKVLICLSCMILLVISSLIPMDSSAITQTWSERIYYVIFTIILTAIIMWTVGLSIFKACFIQLTRSFNVNMITLISVGSGLAFIFGCIYLVTGIARTANGCHDNLYYYIDNAAEHLQTSAAIFTSVVTGKYIQGRIKKRIVRKISQLKSKMRVSSALINRIVPKNKQYDILSTETLHPALIERGDIIQLNNGLLPFDGFLRRGTVKVMENAQFGSEKIENRSKGHRIISGSQIVSAEDEPLLEVSDPLEQTTAGKLFLEIKETTSGNSSGDKVSQIIAKFTRNFIFLIFSIGLITLIFWLCAYFLEFECATNITISYPFERAIAVLVASCPCALGTAIPMIYAIVLRRSLNHGVLVKDASSIDSLHNIDTIVFDKTGTITGTYQVIGSEVIDAKYDEASLWELVSLVEQNHLQHPVGLTLYQEALKKISELKKSKISIIKKDQPTESENYIGAEGIIVKGIEIDGRQMRVAIGNKKILSRFGIRLDVDQETERTLSKPESSGCCSSKMAVLPVEEQTCCSIPTATVTSSCCGGERKPVSKEDCCSKTKVLESCCSENKIVEAEECCSSKQEKSCCSTQISSEKKSGSDCCASNESGNEKKCCSERNTNCCPSETQQANKCCSESNEDSNEAKSTNICCSKKQDDCFSFRAQEPCCSNSKPKIVGENEQTTDCCKLMKESSCCKVSTGEEYNNQNISILTEESPINLPPTKQNEAQVEKLYLVIHNKIVMEIALNIQESLKENTEQLIQGLMENGKEVHLLTGDNYENALLTAQTIGIPESNVKAGVTPQEKVIYLENLQNNRHRKVLMVGDGINDIIAFKQADLSCTINFKSSQNLSFSNFVIMDNNVENILGLFILARATSFARNLIILASILYNIPIILAASGCTMILFGFELPAFMAAWAMFLSSVVLTLLANLVEFARLKKKSMKKIVLDEIITDTNSKGYKRFD